MRISARLPKVHDYLDWYLDWYEAEHLTTISKARSEVKRFIERFGHRQIDSIRAVEVEQYKRQAAGRQGDKGNCWEGDSKAEGSI